MEAAAVSLCATAGCGMRSYGVEAASAVAATGTEGARVRGCESY